MLRGLRLHCIGTKILVSEIFRLQPCGMNCSISSLPSIIMIIEHPYQQSLAVILYNGLLQDKISNDHVILGYYSPCLMYHEI
jgi:hypothetical protein